MPILPTFPSLSQNPEFPMITEPIWDTTITHFEGKVEQRRSNIAREKKRFRFQYKAISTEDKDLLEDFFILVEGTHSRFNWTNPQEGRLTYRVRFENSELDMQYMRYGQWNIGEIRLIEVF